jgi:hypothetical protein
MPLEKVTTKANGKNEPQEEEEENYFNSISVTDHVNVEI